LLSEHPIAIIPPYKNCPDSGLQIPAIADFLFASSPLFLNQPSPQNYLLKKKTNQELASAG